MTNEFSSIDPALALEIIPRKIDERKRIIAEIDLELAIAREVQPEAPVPERILHEREVHCKFLASYERRLAALQEALG